MVGRKRKPDALRFVEMTEKIEKLERISAVWQEQLRRCKVERIAVLSHLIVGRMEVLRLNYPQVESLLTSLFKGEPTKQQRSLAHRQAVVTPASDEDESKTVQLIIRVTAKEKRQIYANMEQAHYSSFSSYARKMLLDGHLILWTSSEIRELKKELGAVNRSLNQLLRRGTASGKYLPMSSLNF